LSVRYFNKGAI